MSGNLALHAFTGYGIELEYMIVDQHTLAVIPMADELLRMEAGSYVSDVARGKVGWSNELVKHLIEIKNPSPVPAIAPLVATFQAEIQYINRLLAPHNAMLMPSAMHPWMNPSNETRLWDHDHADIYQAFDHIFNCKQHGWANLQSMHLNLPFFNDEEFSRLHAAIRLVLPIIPAIAASSPIIEGNLTHFQDCRMEVYRSHPIKIPSIIGQVIPETAMTKFQYAEQILSPMYRDIAIFDPDGVLQHEWLNARGAIPRFDRNAIEIRVIDLQECPQADLAIASAVIAVVRAFYDNHWATLEKQQQFSTERLVQIMHHCIRDAEKAMIEDADFLTLMGFPVARCEARELWRHFIEVLMWHKPAHDETEHAILNIILEQGPLARRILQAVSGDFSHQNLKAVYLSLCNCLENGQVFQPQHA
ncbi:carboxylate-amine ligase [Sulfurirhabdus autotrophica]|uniref:Glutamate-cysteine ligase n=1 Tax=Sulfurirhabdus autotrophica TaxID=1706046 RepID=A0A4R3YIC1_9PROT|nr:glutamate-cysteine ligase family protein [Sulfurirhabdus autotrophica]TCV90393.1 glutamate-cysteine ligase [Sulfurirhabdus autotrophica]